MNYKNTLILSTLVISVSVVGFAAFCRYVNDKSEKQRAQDLKDHMDAQLKDWKEFADAQPNKGTEK